MAQIRQANANFIHQLSISHLYSLHCELVQDKVGLEKSIQELETELQNIVRNLGNFSAHETNQTDDTKLFILIHRLKSSHLISKKQSLDQTYRWIADICREIRRKSSKQASLHYF